MRPSFTSALSMHFTLRLVTVTGAGSAWSVGNCSFAATGRNTSSLQQMSALEPLKPPHLKWRKYLHGHGDVGKRFDTALQASIHLGSAMGTISAGDGHGRGCWSWWSMAVDGSGLHPILDLNSAMILKIIPEMPAWIWFCTRIDSIIDRLLKYT